MALRQRRGLRWTYLTPTGDVGSVCHVGSRWEATLNVMGSTLSPLGEDSPLGDLVLPTSLVRYWQEEGQVGQAPFLVWSTRPVRDDKSPIVWWPGLVRPESRHLVTSTCKNNDPSNYLLESIVLNDWGDWGFHLLVSECKSVTAHVCASPFRLVLYKGLPIRAYITSWPTLQCILTNCIIDGMVFACGKNQN